MTGGAQSCSASFFILRIVVNREWEESLAERRDSALPPDSRLRSNHPTLTAGITRSLCVEDLEGEGRAWSFLAETRSFKYSTGPFARGGRFSI